MAGIPADRAPAPPEAPALAMTTREQRVRQRLLAALRQVNRKLAWSEDLTYKEKQYLDKTLDPAYIEDELRRMRSGLRLQGVGAALALALGLPGALLAMGISGAIALTCALVMGLGGTLLAFRSAEWTSPFGNARHLRHRLFIYESLYDLSGADEQDVVLDRVIREADALIARFTDHDLTYDLPRR
ncbi:MAG: hypothetical protein AAGI71_06910 [Bacteroidota bacterium]